MNEDESKKAVSRRNFLKGTATGVAGIAAATLLGGCDKKGSPGASTGQTVNTTGTTTQFPANYEVINSDLLIIGAGFGAVAAAYEAIAKGKRVTMIEKAPYRHGGAHGFNWDAIPVWLPDMDLFDYTIMPGVNEVAHFKAQKSYPNMDMGTTYLNRGQFFPDREADGKIKWYMDFPMARGVQGLFPRLTNDDLARSPLLTIFDQTMVTDLFINDGRCIGVMGLYLPTGDFRVFRAPATILATGATCWFYGWNTVSANTINSADNTGDVDMAAFRHGAGIGNSEYAGYDFATTYPEGLAYGWNTSLNPDANEWKSFADKKGNLLWVGEKEQQIIEQMGNRRFFNLETAKMMLNGAMTKDGGLLANLENDELRPAIRQNLAVFEKFGVDPRKEMLPIHDEIYERGGTPVVDDTAMSVDIQGLFCVRGAGIDNGTDGGSHIAVLNVRGSYALRSALSYISQTPPIKEIDWTPVEAEYNRLHELRTRQVGKGIRPHVVRQAIQVACGTCMGILRETKKLEAAAKELARIREEDMPKMVVTNQTQTWNREWKEAIENHNLLDTAELAILASLLREESRGTYLRPEFPDMDDENWDCMLVGKLVDGKFDFSKVTLPKLNS